MELYYSKFGKGHPMIILHGLYGQGDNWRTIAKAFSSFCEVYLVDQRNHGRSPHSSQHDYESMSVDLIEFMDRLGLERAILLGHSMGGKTAMCCATMNPGRITKLIIADISPASYHPTTGKDSHQSFHLNIMQTMLAVHLEQMATIHEIDQQMEERIPDKRIRQFLLKNLVKRDGGGYKWQLNLLGLINNLDKLLDGVHPNTTGQREFSDFPSLFIRGELSFYVKDSDIRLIKQIFPLAQVTTIKQAGHWLHAEEPKLFREIVRQFLIS